MWRDLRLRTLWLGFIGIVICGFAFQTLLPGLLEQELGRDSHEIGPIFLVLAVAGLVVNLQLAAVVGHPLGRGGPGGRWASMLALGFGLVADRAGVRAGAGRGHPPGHRPLGLHARRQLALLMANADPSYHGRVMSLAMMGFGSQSLLAPVWGAHGRHGIGVRVRPWGSSGWWPPSSPPLVGHDLVPGPARQHTVETEPGPAEAPAGSPIG